MKRLLSILLLLSLGVQAIALDRNTAGYIELQAVDTSTGTPKTGDAANITAYRSIDGGATTALTDTSATEISSTNTKGVYRFDVTAAETNGRDITFSGKSTTSNIEIISRFVTTVPANFDKIVPTSTDTTTALTMSVVAMPFAGSATGINVTTSAVTTTPLWQAYALGGLDGVAFARAVLGIADPHGAPTTRPD